MALQLKKIEDVQSGQLADFIKDLKAEGSLSGSMAKYNGDFDAFKEHLHTMETDPPRLMPNSTMWFLCDEENILGAVEVRHFLNDGLLRYGGHIGYVVSPEHRGNGYAFQILEMVKPQLKKLKLEMVLICCQEDNTASRKTIEKAGGELENTVEIIRGGVKKTGLRYWIEI